MRAYHHVTRNTAGEREARAMGLRAMRKGSHLLVEMERTGTRVPARTRTGMRIGTQPGLRLPQLGITRKESHKWQRIGRLTVRQFRALLDKGDRPRRGKVKKIAPTPLPKPSPQSPATESGTEQQQTAAECPKKPDARTRNSRGSGQPKDCSVWG